MDVRRAASVAFAIVVLPASAAAQADLSAIYPGPKRVDVSVAGGFRLSTDWSNLVLLGTVSPVSGTVEQVLARDLHVRPGPVFDAAVTYWEGRYGFRTHVGFAESCLTAAVTCGDGVASSADVNAWMYDIGGSIGLIDYRRGAWVWPYVLIGFGGVTYDLERTVGAPLTFIERRPPRVTDGGIIVSGDEPDPLLIAIDELSLETKFALNLGIGTDVRVPLGPTSVGLRLEVSDHIHRSPIDILLVHVGSRRVAPSSTRVDSGHVHNLRVAGGLVLQLGR